MSSAHLASILSQCVKTCSREILVYDPSGPIRHDVLHFLTTYLYKFLFTLTHWDRVTHMYVSKLATSGLDKGLSPGRCQAIIWTNGGMLLIRTSEPNFNEILIGINTFSFMKMPLNMSSAKWRPFWPQCVKSKSNGNHFYIPWYTADNTVASHGHRADSNHPSTQLFVQHIFHANNKEIIMASHHKAFVMRIHWWQWILLKKAPVMCHRWIPLTKGQWSGKCFHVMTLSWPVQNDQQMS